MKGEVTSSKSADLNEAVRMAYKFMKQKSQARDVRILEGKKRKWENLQSGNSSGKGNQRDNSHQTLQNSQKQGNARAMVTAPTDGKLPLCELCFTRHDGHTRNRCPKKIKQEEVGEVHGRAYAIKDAEPQELGTFDVIIGMDWLVKHDAVIVCGEKVVRIPYGNKTLIVESDKGVSRLKVISCIKTLPGAAPVARAPYRFAPSEMKELLVQLQELQEKGSIRPSSSP
ncbi:putative reverse transcriptase domain-containing protein [Tanacetum coccineum]